MIHDAWPAAEKGIAALLHGLDGMLAAHAMSRPWSWGIAVIILTILFRIVLLPTLAWQLRFTQRMAALQPEIEAIRARHGVSKALLRSSPSSYAVRWARAEEEQGALLKENGVRWYLGLLPALVQIPVVVAVLRVLGNGPVMEDLTPATWSFLPTPTQSFLHSPEPRPLLVILAVVLGGLVHLNQRERVNSVAEPVRGAMRQARLYLVPVLAGCLALNLGFAVLVSVAASMAWGIVQERWVEGRSRESEAPACVGAKA